jgi:hypothetical protein
MSLTDAQAPACSAVLSALFPAISIVIADAGHESRKLVRLLSRSQG